MIKYGSKIPEPSDNPVKLLVFILVIQKLGSFRYRLAYIGKSTLERTGGEGGGGGRDESPQSSPWRRY